MLTDAVISANGNFYRALSNADFHAMTAIWKHSQKVSCVHPGWPMLVGWEKVGQSWKAIFTNQGPIRVWPSNVKVRVAGDVSWVTCVENIDATDGITGVMIQTQATNIFHHLRGEWKMVHHHASPLPSERQTRPGLSFSSN